MRDVRFKAYIGWRGRNSGVAQVGRARVAPAINTVGYERIGYAFTPSYTGPYDNVSGPGRYSALGFNIQRGRDSRWSGVVAGQCALALHDLGDGRYNPENTGSPLYGMIEPMLPCKITAVLEDGVTEEDLFHGWLDEQTNEPDFNSQTSTFLFKDLLMWLDGDAPVIVETGPIYVGDAIGLILDWFNWTNPARRSLAHGSLLPGFSAVGDKSGTQLVGDILKVDLGVFFHSRKGVATYLDRWEYARRVGIGAFQGVQRVIPGVARSNLRNRITVSFDTGDPATTIRQTIEDTTSRQKYGPLAWDDVVSPYFGSDDDALRHGAYKVAQGKSPTPPVWTFTASEGFAGDFDRIVKADLIDRVTVANPNNIDYHIERISHRAAAGELLQSDWLLSKRATNQAALVGRARVAANDPSTWAGYDRVTY